VEPRLDDLDAVVQNASREALPALIGRLAQLHALALARLVQPVAPPPVENDKLLTAEEASTLSGLTVRQLKSRRLPFRKRLGHRTIRFSERGLRAWLRRTP
jgi:predicted DNA-binding transcriptional regulator AlpA